jgi:hypothetical protein
MTTTKKLIVTETIRYEFELSPDHAEDHDSLKALFCAKQDPWSEADFAAITERDFDVETWQPLPACLEPQSQPQR